MCSACGATYEDESWASLVLSRQIEPQELRLLVRDWPENLYRLQARSLAPVLALTCSPTANGERVVYQVGIAPKLVRFAATRDRGGVFVW
jgi:hypothetical protein